MNITIITQHLPGSDVTMEHCRIFQGATRIEFSYDKVKVIAKDQIDSYFDKKDIIHMFVVNEYDMYCPMVNAFLEKENLSIVTDTEQWIVITITDPESNIRTRSCYGYHYLHSYPGLDFPLSN